MNMASLTIFLSVVALSGGLIFLVVYVGITYMPRRSILVNFVAIIRMQKNTIAAFYVENSNTDTLPMADILQRILALRSDRCV